MCLALASRDAPNVDDIVGVALGFFDDDVGRLVAAAVIDDVDAKAVEGVVQRHEALDGHGDHSVLVPGRNQDADPRQVLASALQVGAEEGDRDQQELVQAGEHRQGGQEHQAGEQADRPQAQDFHRLGHAVLTQARRSLGDPIKGTRGHDDLLPAPHDGDLLEGSDGRELLAHQGGC